MNHIIQSLDNLINKSIEADKDGNSLQALEYLKKFEEKKNEAVSIAREASKNGDIELVDEILSSINKLEDNNKTENNKKNISQLIELYNKSEFKEVILHIENMLSENDRNPNLYNILGLSYFRIGGLKISLQTFNEGLKKFPEDFNLNNNICVLYKEIKKFDKALAFGMKSFEINSESDEAAANLANIFFEKTDYAKALTFYKKSISLNPENPKTIINFANCNLKLNNLNLAKDAANLALRHEPNNYEFLNIKGQILKEMGKYDEALEIYYKSLNLRPDSPYTLNNLAMLYQEQTKYPESIELFLEAIRIENSNPYFYSNLANSYLHTGENKKALEYLDKSIIINPEFYIAYLLKGSVYAHLGEKQKAIKNYNKAIKNNGLDTEAHRHLSSLKHYKLNDPHIKEMEKLFKSPLLKNEDKAILSFGLGKAYEDIKNYSKSFSFYKSGNDFYKNKYQPKIISQQIFFKSLINNCIETSSEKKYFNNYNITPIFVLGLPRSGTSLVEQILSSHSLIEGLGELTLLSNYIEDNLITYKKGGSPILKRFGLKEQKQLSNFYMNSIPRIDKNKKYFVDKMPHNFRWMSYIQNSFISPKVVLVERDPMDNCYSLFKMLFSSKKQHSYSFDLEILGKYYLIYKDMIDHWKNIYQSNIITCKYEELISNPEIEISKILSYCGLNWENNVLNFHKTKRTVKTASHAQVRQKLYKSSIGLWKNNKDDLTTLSKLIS